VRLLIVEDDPELASILADGLADHHYEVVVAADVPAARDRAVLGTYDVMILDVLLPGGSGFDLCAQIRSRGIATPILMLTARDAIDDRVRGLEAGADDYLTKPFALDELVARIRTVLRRFSREADGNIRVADLEVDVPRREARRGGRVIDLTTREFDLLRLLAENAGRPVRRETILTRIWGVESEPETDAVKVYINHLRRKLNEGEVEDLIHSIRGFGYVLKG